MNNNQESKDNHENPICHNKDSYVIVTGSNYENRKNKKAPLMELRSFLRVGITLMMTTTMKILNQKKGADAIWNHINVLFVATTI